MEVCEQIEYTDLLNTFLRTMHSLLGCRVILNLRRAKEEDLPLDEISIEMTNRRPAEEGHFELVFAQPAEGNV
jgi:hypothetical protein